MSSRGSDGAAPSQPARAPLRGLLRSSNAKKRRGIRGGGLQGEIRVNEYFYQAYVNPVLIPPAMDEINDLKDWDERIVSSSSIAPCIYECTPQDPACSIDANPFSRTTPSRSKTGALESFLDASPVRAYSPKLFDDTGSSVATFIDACVTTKQAPPHSDGPLRSSDALCDNDTQRSPQYRCDSPFVFRAAATVAHSISVSTAPQGEKRQLLNVSPPKNLSSVSSTGSPSRGTRPSDDDEEPPRRFQPSRTFRSHPASNKLDAPQRSQAAAAAAAATAVDSEQSLKQLRDFSLTVRQFIEHETDQYGSRNLPSGDSAFKESKLASQSTSGSHEYILSKQAVSAYETPFCSLDPLFWDTELFYSVAGDIAALVRLRAEQGGRLTLEECWHHRDLVVFLIRKHTQRLFKKSVCDIRSPDTGTLQDEVSSAVPNLESKLWTRITKQLNQQSDPLQRYVQAAGHDIRSANLLQHSTQQLLRHSLTDGASPMTLFPAHTASDSQADFPASDLPLAPTSGDGAIESFQSLCKKFQHYAQLVSRIGMWKEAVRELYGTKQRGGDRPLLHTAMQLLHQGRTLRNVCDIQNDYAILERDVTRCTDFQELLMKEMPTLFQISGKMRGCVAERTSFSRLRELARESELLPFAVPARLYLTRSVKEALTWQMMVAAAVSGKDLDRCKDLLDGGGHAAVELSGVTELRDDVQSGQWIELVERSIVTKKPFTLSQLKDILPPQSLVLISTRLKHHPAVEELTQRCLLAAQWLLKVRVPPLFRLLTAADIVEVDRGIELCERLLGLYASEQCPKESDDLEKFHAWHVFQRVLSQIAEITSFKQSKQTSSPDASTINSCKAQKQSVVEPDDTTKHCAPQVANSFNTPDTENSAPGNERKANTENVSTDARCSSQPTSEVQGGSEPSGSSFGQSSQRDTKTNGSETASFHVDATQDSNRKALLTTPEALTDICDEYFSARIVVSAFKTLDAFRHKVKRWQKRQLRAVSGHGAVTAAEVTALINEGAQLSVYVELSASVSELTLVLHNYRLWVQRVDELLSRVRELLSQTDISRASSQLLTHERIYKPSATGDDNGEHRLPEADGDMSTSTAIEELLSFSLDRPSLDDATSLLLQHEESPIIDSDRGRRLRQIKDSAERWRRRARDIIKAPKGSPAVDRARLQLLIEARYLSVNVAAEQELIAEFFLKRWRERVAALVAPVEEQVIHELYSMPREKGFLELLADTPFVRTQPPATKTDFVCSTNQNLVRCASPVSESSDGMRTSVHDDASAPSSSPYGSKPRLNISGDEISHTSHSPGPKPHENDTLRDRTIETGDTEDVSASQKVFASMLTNLPEKELLPAMQAIVESWKQKLADWTECAKVDLLVRPTFDDWNNLLNELRDQPVRLRSVETAIQNILDSAATLQHNVEDLPQELDFNVLEGFKSRVVNCPVRLPQWETYSRLIRHVVAGKTRLAAWATLPLDPTTVSATLEHYLHQGLPQDCQYGNVRVTPSSLPEYASVRERLESVTAWVVEVEDAQLCAEGRTLKHWEALLHKASCLHLVSPNIETLKKEAHFSALWFQLFLTVCMASASVPPSSPMLSVEETNPFPKLALSVAQAVVSQEIGLGSRLTLFHDLSRNVTDALQFCQSLAPRLLATSYEQRRRHYFAIAARTESTNITITFLNDDLLLLEWLPALHKTEAPSEAAVDAILGLTRRLNEKLLWLQSLRYLAVGALEEKLKQEISLRRLHTKVVLCLRSSIALRKTKSMIPLTAAAAVLSEVRAGSSEPSMVSTADFCTLRASKALSEFRNSMTQAHHESENEYQAFCALLGHVAQQLEAEDPIDIWAGEAKIFDGAEDIAALADILSHRVQSTQLWVERYDVLSTLAYLPNINRLFPFEHAQERLLFTWPDSEAGYWSYIHGRCEPAEASSNASNLEEHRSGGSKVARRSKGGSVYNTNRRLLPTSVISEILEDSDPLTSLTLGDVLEEGLITRLDDFVRAHCVKPFRCALILDAPTHTDSESLPWANLLTPLLLLGRPIKPQFPDRWKGRREAWRSRQLGTKQQLSWEEMTSIQFPTLENAWSLLKAANSELFFNVDHYELLRQSLGAFLAALTAIESHVPSTLVKSSAKGLPAARLLATVEPTATKGSSFSSLVTSEALKLVELLDLSPFQVQLKENLVAGLLDAFHWSLQLQKAFLLLPLGVESFAVVQKGVSGDGAVCLAKTSFDVWIRDLRSALKPDGADDATWVNVKNEFSVTSSQLQKVLQKRIEKPTCLKDAYLAVVSGDFQINTVDVALCSFCGLPDPPLSKVDGSASASPWVSCKECRRCFHAVCADLPEPLITQQYAEHLGLYSFRCSFCLLRKTATPSAELLEPACNVSAELSLVLSSRWLYLFFAQQLELHSFDEKNKFDDTAPSTAQVIQCFPSITAFLDLVYGVGISFVVPEKQDSLDQRYVLLLLWLLDICSTLLWLLGTASNTSLHQPPNHLLPPEELLKVPTKDEGTSFEIHPDTSTVAPVVNESVSAFRPTTRSSSGALRPSSVKSLLVQTRVRQSADSSTRHSGAKSAGAKKRRRVSRGKSVNATATPKGKRQSPEDIFRDNVMTQFLNDRPGCLTRLRSDEPNDSDAASVDLKSGKLSSAAEFENRPCVVLNVIRTPCLMQWFEQAVTADNLQQVCEAFFSLFVSVEGLENVNTVGALYSAWKSGVLKHVSVQGLGAAKDRCVEMEWSPVCGSDPSTIWNLARFIIEGAFLGINNISLLRHMLAVFSQLKSLDQELQKLIPQIQNTPSSLPALDAVSSDTLQPYVAVTQTFHFTRAFEAVEQIKSQCPIFSTPAHFQLIELLEHITQQCFLALDVLAVASPKQVLGLERIQRQGKQKVYSATEHELAALVQSKGSLLKTALMQGDAPPVILRLFEEFKTLVTLREEVQRLVTGPSSHGDCVVPLTPEGKDSAMILRNLAASSTTTADNEPKIRKRLFTQLDDIQKTLNEMQNHWDKWSHLWRQLLENSLLASCALPGECQRTSPPTPKRYKLDNEAPSLRFSPSQAHSSQSTAHPADIKSSCTSLLFIYSWGISISTDTFFSSFENLKTFMSRAHTLVRQAEALYAATQPEGQALDVLGQPVVVALVLKELEPEPYMKGKLFSFSALESVIKELEDLGVGFEHFDALNAFYTEQKTVIDQIDLLRKAKKAVDLNEEKRLLTQETYNRWVSAMEKSFCCWGEHGIWLAACRERVNQWIDQARTMTRSMADVAHTYQDVITALASATSLKKVAPTLIVDLSRTHLFGDVRRCIRELRTRKQVLATASMLAGLRDEPGPRRQSSSSSSKETKLDDCSGAKESHEDDSGNLLFAPTSSLSKSKNLNWSTAPHASPAPSTVAVNAAGPTPRSPSTAASTSSKPALSLVSATPFLHPFAPFGSPPATASVSSHHLPASLDVSASSMFPQHNANGSASAALGLGSHASYHSGSSPPHPLSSIFVHALPPGFDLGSAAAAAAAAAGFYSTAGANTPLFNFSYPHNTSSVPTPKGTNASEPPPNGH